MSVIEGLKAYQARKAEEDARREAASKPKIQRFALEKGGDSVVVRIVQEIDPDAANYSEKNGIGFINIEHTCGADPKNGWLNRGNCTIESQGACFPCEKASDYSVEWNDRKGWKQKEKLYLQLVGGEPREVVEKVAGKEKKRYFTTDVDTKTGDGVVYLLEQGTYNGIWDDLVNYFITEDVSENTITDKFFKITRKGDNFNDTKYSIMPLKALPKGAKDVEEFELYDVREEVLKEVPYAQQKAFYYKGIHVEDEDTPSASDEPVAASAASSGDDTW